MNPYVRSIRSDLKKHATKKIRDGAERFFKEPVKFYGVQTGIVGDIARKHWREVSLLSKKEIFDLCEILYQSGLCEESFIVSFWLPKYAKAFELKDIHKFQHWIETYINNWASCDGFCNHTVGMYIQKYPEQIHVLKKWTTSKNRWMKRAAAVSLIVPAKHGKFLADVFEIADRLLMDSDDMVQKGYGWMLKVASQSHQQEVFEYVMKHKKVMPRTALRYAIELMPANLRSQAMEK